MQGIIDFISLIGTLLASVFQFFVDLVMDLVFIVQLTVRFLADLPAYFAWLPSPVLALLITIVTVMVIYKISGRS